MKLGIMQPYFFPYIGYFQLMSAVDEFIVYDKIEFTKKGWINRNRILVNGQDSWITLPIKNDSDYLDVKDRCLAKNWPTGRMKMLNRIKASYRKAPQFDRVYQIIENSLFYDDSNLFNYIFNSLTQVKEYLDIKTPFIASSTIPIDNTLKAENKVIALCKARKADTYVNPIGGLQLYNKESFIKEGIDLHFLKAKDFEYPQYDNEFVPWLSIIDVMMFNSREKIQEYLNSFYILL